MTHDDREREFLEHARRLLQDSAEGLDEAIAADLRSARRQAITRSMPRAHRGWLWAGSLATVAVAAVVTLSIWLPGTRSNNVPVSGLNNVEDVDLLSGAEGIQFYRDLEFYRWLDHEQDAS